MASVDLNLLATAAAVLELPARLRTAYAACPGRLQFDASEKGHSTQEDRESSIEPLSSVDRVAAVRCQRKGRLHPRTVHLQVPVEEETRGGYGREEERGTEHSGQWTTEARLRRLGLVARTVMSRPVTAGAAPPPPAAAPAAARRRWLCGQLLLLI